MQSQMIKTLYKYRGNSEFTDKIFTEQSVWLSNAKGLNDPFECTIQEIAKEYIEKQVKIMKEAQLMGFAHSSLTNPDQAKAAVAEQIRKAGNLDEKHKIMRDAYLKYAGIRITNPIDIFLNFDEQLQSAGIFSLTEDPLNELMWAHYGDNSKGIAIGFTLENGTQLSNKEKCIKLNYSNELPKFESDGFKIETSFYSNGINKQKIAFNDPTFLKAISTKSKNWSYEKEWRYIEPSSGAYPLPSNISEVIFGLRTEKELQKKYHSLVQKLPNFKDINFFKIEKVANMNSLKMTRVMDYH